LQEVRQDLSPILTAFPRDHRAALPALQRVQAELGSLPLWAIGAVAEHLRVPKSELYGVATHYPELRLEPRGERVVRVCTGLSCRVVGAPAVLGALEATLGVRAGQTTADGAVSLEETHCAFICGVAPVVEVDGVAHGGLSAEQAAALARRLVATP
jgi:NADH:ubiquinone oxidoreductase subunit E